MPVRKRIQLLIPVVIVVALGAAAAWWLRQQHAPKELVLAGTLEARTVNVGSLAGGRVVGTYVDEGTHVRAGTLLVKLETDTVDRQLAEQKAAISAAQAALAKAIAGPRVQEIEKSRVVANNDAAEERRTAALYHDGIASREMYDAAVTKARASSEDLRLLEAGTRPEDVAAARAAVEQQQGKYSTLLKQRAETDVVSSVDGVVQSFGLRPGDLVTAGQPVAEILEASQLWVRVYVPETLLGLVRVGQPVKVRIDTFPNVAFAGHVATVSSQGEYTPRNIQTQAQRADQVFGVKVLVDPDPRLKAGMAAQVDLGVKGHFE